MTDQPASANPAGMLRRFKRRFWQPPRAHGDVIEDRTVSFLELFYDSTTCSTTSCTSSSSPGPRTPWRSTSRGAASQNLPSLLLAILSAVWWLAVDRWLRLDNPSDAQPNAGVSATPGGSA